MPALARTGQPVAADAAGAALRHGEERLVGGQRDAVGEPQPVPQDLRLATRPQPQELPGGGVLQDVAQPVLQGLAAAGDGEVEGAVRRRDDVAAEPQRGAGHLVGEDAHRSAARVDAQQPAPGVAHQQFAVGGGDQTQRPAAGLGDHLGAGEPRRVRQGQPPDRPVRGPGEDPAPVVEGHVLGPPRVAGDDPRAGQWLYRGVRRGRRGSVSSWHGAHAAPRALAALTHRVISSA